MIILCSRVLGSCDSDFGEVLALVLVTIFNSISLHFAPYPPCFVNSVFPNALNAQDNGTNGQWKLSLCRLKEHVWKGKQKSGGPLRCCDRRAFSRTWRTAKEGFSKTCKAGDELPCNKDCHIGEHPTHVEITFKVVKNQCYVVASSARGLGYASYHGYQIQFLLIIAWWHPCV